jgi:hypothetical protein
MNRTVLDYDSYLSHGAAQAPWEGGALLGHGVHARGQHGAVRSHDDINGPGFELTDLP